MPPVSHRVAFVTAGDSHGRHCFIHVPCVALAGPAASVAVSPSAIALDAIEAAVAITVTPMPDQ
jgi:hypothetical protein